MINLWLQSYLILINANLILAQERYKKSNLLKKPS